MSVDDLRNQGVKVASLIADNRFLKFSEGVRSYGGDPNLIAFTSRLKV